MGYSDTGVGCELTIVVAEMGMGGFIGFCVGLQFPTVKTVLV